MGNIVNRVFDSSGPEGKVRGTPQQIIDKYNQLARDAQLGNDRVAAENFQQHAEHYTRMLNEALQEQESQRQQQQDRENERRDRREDNQSREQGDQPDPRANRPVFEGPKSGGDAAEDGADTGSDTGLVETPEDTASRPRRGRRPRKQAEEQTTGSDAPEAAE